MENGPAAAEFAALADRVSELGRMCARLSQENGALRDQVERLSAVRAAPGAQAAAGAAVRSDSGGGLVSRRMVGRSLGVAAAAAVGAGALIETSARPAAATNGDSVIAGQATTAESATSVKYNGGTFGGVVLLGNDSAYNPGVATYPAAAGGWAGAGTTVGSGGTRNGVYGYTDNGTGYGVVGWNTFAVGTGGAGVLGRGSGAGIGVEGWSGSGMGVFGTTTGIGGYGVYGNSASGTGVYGQTGSTAADANAVYGVITSTGPGGFSAAVRGQNNGTGGLGIGVYGSQNGTGWGVLGAAGGGIGVYGTGGAGSSIGVQGVGTTGVNAEGSTTGLTASGPTAISAIGSATGLTASAPTGIRVTGTGAAGRALVATNTSDTTGTMRVANGGHAPAIQATSAKGTGIVAASTGGRGGTFSGTAAQVRLIPGKGKTHPASGQAGDLYVDATGRLWYCKKTGTTGWHQIA